MRGDSSTIGGDPGKLLERTTQFLKRSGNPYAMTCKMGNATCASSAEDLEEALQYSLVKTAVLWSYDDLIPRVSLDCAYRQGL